MLEQNYLKVFLSVKKICRNCIFFIADTAALQKFNWENSALKTSLIPVWLYA